MWRANIKNRSFDWMGEEWAPLIDPNHFLGKSAFDIPYPKNEAAPAASLELRGELLVLKIEVPEYKKENLQVEIKNDILFVKGNKEKSVAGTSSELVSKELQRDSFERMFKLTPSIAREGVSAQLKEGQLQIHFVDVPEEEEEKNNRKVEIE